MAKWYGRVGYIVTTECEPGIWKGIPMERNYYGDVLSNTSRWASTDKVNDDLNVSNKISIVADPFAYQNFRYIKYVEFMGALWEVTNADASQRPRIVLTIGGVYNGEQVSTAN